MWALMVLREVILGSVIREKIKGENRNGILERYRKRNLIANFRENGFDEGNGGGLILKSNEKKNSRRRAASVEAVARLQSVQVPFGKGGQKGI